MLFNSINYALFLPVVFTLYWAIKSHSWKNRLLLAASYFFYACWDWRFLFLLMFSTGLDYVTGIKIQSTSYKKLWLWLSIIINVGFLGIFKYYDFFVISFINFISHVGFKVHPATLNVILPVGISFYTFHGLSYVIDVYKGRINSEKNVIDYCLFVSFFPLLVAGPIERATHLLPQLKKKRAFNYDQAADGLKQILWGLFKKIAIADQCAVYANMIFKDATSYSGSTLTAGALFFAIQIYGDFSGYSDIALGTAKLFGIELLRNFAYPYFSRDIAEFWRRWHISLSSWFRDYLYIPLGGSKGNKTKVIRNILIIFLVSGFWHGANWTFIIWGLLNAIYMLPSIILRTNRTNLEIVAKDKSMPSVKEIAQITLTFCLTVFAWIFFRASDLSHAFSYIAGIFSYSFFTFPQITPVPLLFLIMILFAIEWLGRRQHYALSGIGCRWPQVYRLALYFCLTAIIIYFSGAEQQFIYFQF
ncbi:acyltransferase [Niastella koreensis]|uniref:Membrane bound O-acyl transferase MBOAT family protein n=2 Tax=Niastella koreensis TaxID=354356 RepID=G8TEL4_NIAKG|nr:MBOAT family O-acyltransferase [Niastella koreensis]AEV99436.1 membrane bound O-acyl transferase MBOAT family protein [Niastella koreensis GR20-10]OQP50035.1 acyltransferase [Niastella koreensis]